MAEQDVENLRGAYDSFNAGNPQTVLDLMAPDVEWIEPGGGNSASGTFSGPESVAADVFSTIPANFDEFSVNPENSRTRAKRWSSPAASRGRRRAAQTSTRPSSTSGTSTLARSSGSTTRWTKRPGPPPELNAEARRQSRRAPLALACRVRCHPWRGRFRRDRPAPVSKSAAFHAKRIAASRPKRLFR